MENEIDLFPDDFIQLHSHFKSFEDLLTHGNFILTSAEVTQTDEFNEFIKANTDFPNFTEMYREAGNYYLRNIFSK